MIKLSGIVPPNTTATLVVPSFYIIYNQSEPVVLADSAKGEHKLDLNPGSYEFKLKPME